MDDTVDGESDIANVEMMPLTLANSNDILNSGVDFEALAHQHYNRLKASPPMSAMEVDQEADFTGVDGDSSNKLQWPCLPKNWNDWLFPPNVPRACQLLRKENLAVPACYLVVGLLQGVFFKIPLYIFIKRKKHAGK
mmetsp:Transcript_20785/g.23889  ORF Transcript_20785/g.23889 Transcript_20785/m.23889 type:complete len:137 (-) Transcript_20785:224-634(-)